MTQNKIQNIFLITITLTTIIIMLAIFFGIKEYYKPQPNPTLQYNSFHFEKQGAIWYTNWQRNKDVYRIGLRNSPAEVEHIPITGNFSNNFNKKNKIYITFDPFSDNTTYKYQALAASELTTQLTGPLSKQPIAACTRGEQTPACKERPIINCENTDLNVIVLKSEEPTQVLLNQTCITIQGKNEELIKSAEKTLYVWMGIIQTPKVPTK